MSSLTDKRCSQVKAICGMGLGQAGTSYRESSKANPECYPHNARNYHSDTFWIWSIRKAFGGQRERHEGLVSFATFDQSYGLMSQLPVR